MSHIEILFTTCQLIKPGLVLPENISHALQYFTLITISVENINSSKVYAVSEEEDSTSARPRSMESGSYKHNTMVYFGIRQNNLSVPQEMVSSFQNEAYITPHLMPAIRPIIRIQRTI